MEIKFVVEPNFDADEYQEQFTAEVTMGDGTSFTVRATENDVSYAEFRSDIFEDLFRSLAEASGIEVTIEEEDYAAADIDPDDALARSGLVEDYNVADEDRSGC